MVSTQVELTPEQVAKLQELAAQRHVSMTELIRQGIDHILEEAVSPDRATLLERALEVMGQFESGYSDVSSRHDDYLVEAYSSTGDA